MARLASVVESKIIKTKYFQNIREKRIEIFEMKNLNGQARLSGWK